MSTTTTDAVLGYDEALASYDPVMGLEVHVELGTDTKMFCACPTTFGADPNTQVCSVCIGLPGSLPVASAKAIEYAIRIGLALRWLPVPDLLTGAVPVTVRLDDGPARESGAWCVLVGSAGRIPAGIRVFPHARVRGQRGRNVLAVHEPQPGVRVPQQVARGEIRLGVLAVAAIGTATGYSIRSASAKSFRLFASVRASIRRAT